MTIRIIAALALVLGVHYVASRTFAKPKPPPGPYRGIPGGARPFVFVDLQQDARWLN